MVAEIMNPADNPANYDKHGYTSRSSDATVFSSANSLFLKATEATESKPKVMNVAIQVLSIDGLLVATEKSKKKTNGDANSANSGSGPSEMENSATIVASFAHTVSGRDLLSHLPSRPLKLSSNVSNPREVVQHVAHWPTTGGEGSQALSTLEFKRHFEPEDTGSVGDEESSNVERRYTPQACPIHLSISRNGKLVVLGNANVIINGEERGESSITVPITSNFQKSNSPIKKMRNMNIKGKGARNSMVKIKGDQFKFGLKSDSMIRLLVRVSEIDANGTNNDEIKESEEVVEVKAEEENPSKNDTTMDCTESDSDCESVDDCESIEGASIEQDEWEHYMLTQNELRHLRRELSRSENENKRLQSEMIVFKRECQEESDRLCTELKELRDRVKVTVVDLREKLTKAQNEADLQADLVPIYEARITELLEELKEKDVEVECLKEEVAGIRQFYRHQVDTLILDGDDELDSEMFDDIDSCFSSVDAEDESTTLLRATSNMINRIRKSTATETKEAVKDAVRSSSMLEAFSERSHVSVEVSAKEIEVLSKDEKKIEDDTTQESSGASHHEASASDISKQPLEDVQAEKVKHVENDEAVGHEESDCAVIDDEPEKSPDNEECAEDETANTVKKPTTNVDSLLWDNDDTPVSAMPWNRQDNKSVLSPGGEGLSSLLGRIRQIRKKMVEARESSSKEDSSSEIEDTKTDNTVGADGDAPVELTNNKVDAMERHKEMTEVLAPKQEGNHSSDSSDQSNDTTNDSNFKVSMITGGIIDTIGVPEIDESSDIEYIGVIAVDGENHDGSDSESD